MLGFLREKESVKRAPPALAFLFSLFLSSGLVNAILPYNPSPPSFLPSMLDSHRPKVPRFTHTHTTRTTRKRLARVNRTPHPHAHSHTPSHTCCSVFLLLRSFLKKNESQTMACLVFTRLSIQKKYKRYNNKQTHTCPPSPDPRTTLPPPPPHTTFHRTTCPNKFTPPLSPAPNNPFPHTPRTFVLFRPTTAISWPMKKKK